MKITTEIIQKILCAVDAGLCKGMGNPIPGQMCVEAAVCYALGLPHGDDPGCVSRLVRRLKIGLNDCEWSDNNARAHGLRRLAIAQLGTRDTIDEQLFVRRVYRYAEANLYHRHEFVEQSLSEARRLILHQLPAYIDLYEGVEKIVEAARNSAKVAGFQVLGNNPNTAHIARDGVLADFAEGVVQILVELRSPGADWLHLTTEFHTPGNF